MRTLAAANINVRDTIAAVKLLDEGRYRYAIAASHDHAGGYHSMYISQRGIRALRKANFTVRELPTLPEPDQRKRSQPLPAAGER